MSSVCESDELSSAPPYYKVRHILRIAGWNVLVLVVGLLLILCVGEVYLRLAMPFAAPFGYVIWPTRFVADVGLTYEPLSEVRKTDLREFWTTDRSNSLGFLDREPLSIEDSDPTCHITVIGDSFVAASEVPILEKMHVRLEQLVVESSLGFSITTSAFGFPGTAQIMQMPYYEHYARQLSPKLVVLLFVRNDFLGNSPGLYSMRRGWDPDHAPHVVASRSPEGTVELRPPDLNYLNFYRPLPWQTDAIRYLTKVSYLASYLNSRGVIDRWLPYHETELSRMEWGKKLTQRPQYRHIFDDWEPSTVLSRMEKEMLDQSAPAFREAFEYTAFALEEFKRRTERDEAELVVIAESTTMGGQRGGGGAWFKLLMSITESKSIPLLSMYDYVVERGGDPAEVSLTHDVHWSSAGHEYAAEVLFEYLKQNEEICTGTGSG